MENYNIHIDNLIARFLAGEASESEQEELKVWMENSSENKKYFEGIKFVHDKAVASHRIIRVDVDNAWQKLNSRMVPKEQPVITIPVYRKSWFRVAASIIILLGLGAALLFLNKPQDRTLALAFHTADTIQTHIISKTGITLHRYSSLQYIFKKSGRELEIELRGEAFLEVHHSADTSLIVKAGETFIRDIGTSFNVKAYPDSSTIEVYVESGEVAFYTGTNKGLNLKAGQTGVYNKHSKEFHLADAVDINAIAYKSKLFVFNGISLSNALSALNRVYNLKYEIANPALGNCTITVTFDSETPEAIADIIAETLGLQVLAEQDKFIFYGEKCSGQP